MNIAMYQIDAFTDKLFGGNPAAVCPLDHWLDSKILQSIAAENNLAETAFFVNKNDYYDLKWFTPEMEMDLCGHATLASAHVLFRHLGYNKNVIRFTSNAGDLFVKREGDLLAMDFPSRKPVPVPTPQILVEGLGLKPIEVLRSRDYLAVVESEEEVLALNPQYETLKKLDSLGIIVSARGTNCDFVSRFFAPGAGILEDPVTGSAHSTLIPYWSDKLGKKKLHAFQLSARRGELFCEDKGDRVLIAGKAVTYLKGEIEV
jgi:PhzF family phenazine biosynthesis protein